MGHSFHSKLGWIRLDIVSGLPIPSGWQIRRILPVKKTDIAPICSNIPEFVRRALQSRSAASDPQFSWCPFYELSELCILGLVGGFKHIWWVYGDWSHWLVVNFTQIFAASVSAWFLTSEDAAYLW